MPFVCWKAKVLCVCWEIAAVLQRLHKSYAFVLQLFWSETCFSPKTPFFALLPFFTRLKCTDKFSTKDLIIYHTTNIFKHWWKQTLNALLAADYFNDDNRSEWIIRYHSHSEKKNAKKNCTLNFPDNKIENFQMLILTLCALSSL